MYYYMYDAHRITRYMYNSSYPTIVISLVQLVHTIEIDLPLRSQGTHTTCMKHDCYIATGVAGITVISYFDLARQRN